MFRPIKNGAFLTLFISFLHQSLGHQSICLIGTNGWASVVDVHYTVDDTANSGRRGYVSVHRSGESYQFGGLHGHKTWGYFMSISPGDILTVWFTRKEVQFHGRYVVHRSAYKQADQNYVVTDKMVLKALTDQEGNTVYNETFPQKEIPDMWIFITRVHHSDLWDEFLTGRAGFPGALRTVKKLSRSGVDDETIFTSMKDEWQHVEEHNELPTGIYVNMLADGLPYPAGDIVFAFHSDSKKKTEIRREVKQTKEGIGGAFAGWHVPVRPASKIIARFERRAVELELPANVEDIKDINSGFHELQWNFSAKGVFAQTRNSRILFFFHPRHGSMDIFWRKIHRHSKDPKGTHPYWDHEKAQWKVDPLKKLWAQAFEFDEIGGVQPDSAIGSQARSRSMVVIILVGTLLFLGTVGCVCYLMGETELTDSEEQPVSSRKRGSSRHSVSSRRKSDSSRRKSDSSKHKSDFYQRRPSVNLDNNCDQHPGMNIDKNAV